MIREYGILNTHIPPEDSFFYGIPFPGTFLLDEAGVVTDKLFRPHLSTRDTGEAMVDRILGRSVPSTSDPATTFTEDDGIQITAFFRGGRGRLRIGPLNRLIVRFKMPAGLHIYGDPAPDGMTALSIEVEGPDGIKCETQGRPATKALAVPGIESPLQIWDGEVDFEILVFGNTKLAPRFEEPGEAAVEISVLVRYQSCDDAQCFLPKIRRLTLTVPLAKSVVPDFKEMKRSSATTVNMDSMKHREVLHVRQFAKDSRSEG